MIHAVVFVVVVKTIIFIILYHITNYECGTRKTIIFVRFTSKETTSMNYKPVLRS